MILLLVLIGDWILLGDGIVDILELLLLNECNSFCDNEGDGDKSPVGLNIALPESETVITNEADEFDLSLPLEDTNVVGDCSRCWRVEPSIIVVNDLFKGGIVQLFDVEILIELVDEIEDFVEFDEKVEDDDERADD
ncbi:hypothetical protein WICMUC_000174 [Wickerhamomyces mucosus]|uniref:Uncharacterized protein n=1 Tax=Wickerhamomyces mucosus TaxID=1378264 RepID=A0A9P8Q020_9ASCO|nr:hypothetical protein WICMUC_000174 [Wickerhamomyces mucosus]